MINYRLLKLNFSNLKNCDALFVGYFSVSLQKKNIKIFSLTTGINKTKKQDKRRNYILNKCLF